MKTTLKGKIKSLEERNQLLENNNKILNDYKIKNESFLDVYLGLNKILNEEISEYRKLQKEIIQDYFKTSETQRKIVESGLKDKEYKSLGKIELFKNFPPVVQEIIRMITEIQKKKEPLSPPSNSMESNVNAPLTKRSFRKNKK